MSSRMHRHSDFAGVSPAKLALIARTYEAANIALSAQAVRLLEGLRRQDTGCWCDRLQHTDACVRVRQFLNYHGD